MTRALYFPHTEIESELIIKNALLLWDSVDTIVPRQNWSYGQKRRSSAKHLEHLDGTSNTRNSSVFREAVELVVTRRVPDNAERQEAHRTLEELERSGLLFTLVRQSPANWRRREYLVYPEKFLDQTWHLLESGGMARWANEHDYGVPTTVGLLMMSILADVCAGTQLQKITDRNEAYTWIAKNHARLLGSQYVTGLDVSQVAPGHDRLVAISLEVLDGRAIPLKKLVDLRKRESRAGGSGYSAMRRRYLNALQEHLSRIGREARSATDVRELDCEFKSTLKQDLADLKSELGLASVKTLLSKEVALSALILAGSLLSPVAGLTSLGTQVGGIGIIPLLKAAVDHRAARRDALRKHTMSWLFLTKQGRITLR